MIDSANRIAADHARADAIRNFRVVWDRIDTKGRLLCGRLTGSRAYGTHRSDSDWDWSGVYVESVEKVLAVYPPDETVTCAKGDGDDWTFHEARKFLAVLATGNPNALESLFMPADCIVPGEEDLFPFWDELVAHRRLFLTERAIKHTLGYAAAQLRRVRGLPVRTSVHRPDKPVDRWKDACHGLRLMLFARDLAQGREPSVRLEGEALETVKAVRHGAISADAVCALADKLETVIEGAKPWPLAAEFPTKFADDWLYRLRRYSM